MEQLITLGTRKAQIGEQLIYLPTCWEEITAAQLFAMPVPVEGASIDQIEMARALFALPKETFDRLVLEDVLLAYHILLLDLETTELVADVNAMQGLLPKTTGIGKFSADAIQLPKNSGECTMRQIADLQFLETQLSESKITPLQAFTRKIAVLADITTDPKEIEELGTNYEWLSAPVVAGLKSFFLTYWMQSELHSKLLSVLEEMQQITSQPVPTHNALTI